MKCSRCGSHNVQVQAVNQTKLIRKRRGLIYWLLIGWWLQPLLWIFFTLPMLFLALFAPKRQRLKNKLFSVAVCQNCGYSQKLG